MKTKLVIVNFVLDSKNKYVKTIGKNKNSISITENKQYIILHNNCIKAYKVMKNREEALKDSEEDKTIILSYNQAIIKYSIACSKRANFLWRLESADRYAKALVKTIPDATIQVFHKISTQVVIDNPTHIIYQSYDSSKLVRAESVAVLVPHYKDKDGNVKPTQASKWVSEMIGKCKINKEIWI